MRTLLSLVTVIAALGATALAGRFLVAAGTETDGVAPSTRDAVAGRSVPGNWSGLVGATLAMTGEKGDGGDDSASDDDDSSSDSSSDDSSSDSSSDDSSSDSASDDSSSGGFRSAAGVTGGDVVTPCPRDVNGDGAVNVVDLIEVLICFGRAATPGCEPVDLVTDGVVDVMDLLDLLTDLGTSCP